MCGIWGVYQPGGGQRDTLARMAGTLTHRGPDDEGIFAEGPIGLGNRRLSIIDLPGGHQPLSNEDCSVWVVYNGELYNYRELTTLLQERGHRFRTRSDTEVLVHLYEEFGEACVDHLQGMYAFAIWDETRQTLFLARDRLGQKPLFYAAVDGAFYFASEAKAILAATGTHGGPDLETIHHFLSLRFIPAPRTMFRNIRKLPPAHFLRYRNGEVEVRRYWDLSFSDKLAIGEPDLLDMLGDTLRKTISSHLTSDVPVGAFLSGGLDSSTIVAYMAQASTQPVPTFSIGVAEQDFNELPFSRLVAERYGTAHHEATVRPNLIDLLPTIVWHLDEPSDPIAACMYHAAALASQHVKVVMGGDGGDELFAGFDRYAGIRYIDQYARVPAFVRQRLIGPAVRSVPDSLSYKSLTQRLQWAQHLASVPSGGQRYAEATTFFRFTHSAKQALYGEALWHDLHSLVSTDVIVDAYNHADAEDSVDRMLYADFVTRLPEHSLMLTDRMTMAHGLESRSPFLDHSLVELLARVPSQLKIRHNTSKYVLRRLMRDQLPAPIVQRQKQGFMFPLGYWLQNELHAFARNSLLGSRLVKDGLFRRAAVLQLLDEHRERRVDHHVRLWMLINLDVWYRLFVDNESPASVQETLRSFV
jgi:asparagine synthase (glutamine-hydrolysing)